MKVTLINYTPDALTLLLRTKNTRMSNAADDPAAWTNEKREEHLAYMLDTIKSSWEFVDYIFEIEGVTRAFTHQLVRTRTGSYAQQSQRIVDASGFGVMRPDSVHQTPPNSEDEERTGAAVRWWEYGENAMKLSYSGMISNGIPIQDARGILPTNILTSITAKFNLRTLSETAKTRLCTRTQGEYQDVFRAMREAVIAVHPWAAPFIEVHCVANGTCAFPRYGKKECPVYDPRMDLTELKNDAKKKFWAIRHVAAPVAKDGKAS